MKKNAKDFTIIAILTIILITILINSTFISNKVIYAVTLWFNKIFITMYPMFIISDILINYNFINYLSKIFNSIFDKLFNINGATSYVFFMSMLTGSPSNAKFTKELLINNYISLDDANKIIMFSYFSNPLFIINFSTLLFNDYKITIMIIISHYLANIIIGLIFRYLPSSKTNKNIRMNNNNFMSTLTKSINNSNNTLILILGIMISFIIINSLIINIFNLNNIFKLIISSFIEITEGLSLITIITNKTIKMLAFVGIISFGGFSIHMQIKSIIADTKISYKKFLIGRILQSIISIIILLMWRFFWI